MGTISGTTIINNAATELIDTANTRWSRAELLAWINDAQRAIITLQPSANPVTDIVTLAAGTKQTIPYDGFMLLDIYRNMGVGGNTPGNVIRPISRRILDAFLPGWHASASATSVQNFVFEPQNRTVFYVYPPADGTGSLEIVYAQIPSGLFTEQSAITLADNFEPAILAYVLGMAYAKDSEYAGNVQTAQMWMGVFNSLIGAAEKSENEFTPSLGTFARNPQSSGGAN